MQRSPMNANLNWRVNILPVVLLVCWILGTASASITLADERRPNIVFMFTDDQPQNCLGAMGNAAIQTPNMDRLARQGTLFTNAFVTTAICCSNRACILTGQHMNRHGIEDFNQPLRAAAFDQTYPVLLRQAGYRTGFLGKYAIGSPTGTQKDLALPADKFDLWYGFPQSINFRQEIDGQPHYLTEVMTAKAIEFLQAAKPDQPFCLTIAFKEPHGPFNYFDPAVPNDYENVNLPRSPTFTLQDFDAQPDFIQTSLGADASRARLKDNEKYQQELRTFYRTITRADMAVGAILDELARLHLDDNTIVIFSSDHGSLLGDHGLSGKWLMYENSIRVPLIVYDPRLKSGQRRASAEEMVLSIDLAPTMLALAGVKPPPSMQGVSLVSNLSQQPVAWRNHYYYQHTYQTNPPRSPIPRSEGIRTTQWKYIRYPDTTPLYEQLFDLQADPLERSNVVAAAANTELLAQLRQMCDQDSSAR